MAAKIQTAVAQNNAPNQRKAGNSLNVLINSFLDKEGLRRRFDELLGQRTPQFMSALVSLLNAESKLAEAFHHNPMSVIQSALKAAAYDLPIDPALGYAYIVPFNNKKDGVSTPTATFILGYKGMQQLALRTGAYETINVVDIREGELKSYNRLTEEIDLEFIEDEDVRESTQIIGYVGYFKLINGTKKTIYMSKKQIDAHERKHRKGKFMSKGWRDDYEAMCAKTVMRRLIGKWGLMSIDYQQADKRTIAAAEAIATGNFDDEDGPIISDFISDDDADLPDNHETGTDADIATGESELPDFLQ
ncbi:MAG TPA: recombinase RecT [Ruminococcaceae bacterium]|nr:recombinase RecT [Oscillospiraceae bacterium]